MGEMVHLRLDKRLRKRMKQVVKEQDFSSESEFVRTAIRKELELQEKIAILWKMRSSAPLRKHPPKDMPSDIFREFGLS